MFSAFSYILPLSILQLLLSYLILLSHNVLCLFLTSCPHLSSSFLFHISFFNLKLFSAFFLHLDLISPWPFISHSFISHWSLPFSYILPSSLFQLLSYLYSLISNFSLSFFNILPSSLLQLLSYLILLSQIFLCLFLTACPSSFFPISFFYLKLFSAFFTSCPHLSSSFFHISFFYLKLFSAFSYTLPSSLLLLLSYLILLSQTVLCLFLTPCPSSFFHISFLFLKLFSAFSSILPSSPSTSFISHSLISKCSLSYSYALPSSPLQILSYHILCLKLFSVFFLHFGPQLPSRFFHITFCVSNCSLSFSYILALISPSDSFISHSLLPLIFYILKCSMSFSYTLPSSLL